MEIHYFNYTPWIAENRWDRRRFVHKWWKIYAGDPRWVPPAYPALMWALNPAQNPHLARMHPHLIHFEAFPRRATPARHTPHPLYSLSTGAIFDEPVAATAVLRDPRRPDGTAYLALLHCVNDPESLERLLDHVVETVWRQGIRRLVGPTGLSPHLGTGVLQNFWNLWPPLHTPYNPPYLPELMGELFQPLAESRLYHLEIPPTPPPAPPAVAELEPLDTRRLAHDLLPLLVAACPAWADFPPPDEKEAAFLLHWLRRFPQTGWLARVNEQPVGFVLLQPDLARRVRRADGGRHLLWRAWLRWASRRPTRQGRVVLGAVLPAWRGQGIGRQLLHQTLVTGYNWGWRQLSIGPVPTTLPAHAFLERYAAHPRQTYLVYQRDI